MAKVDSCSDFNLYVSVKITLFMIHLKQDISRLVAREELLKYIRFKTRGLILTSFVNMAQK